MTPEQYNQGTLLRGLLRPDHVTAMTRIAQAELGLAVDGMCGPRTRAALEATGARPPQLVGEAVVAFAVTLIGQGETTANNRGSFIERIGGQQGMEWCALSAGYAWRETIMRAGRVPGAHWYRRPGVAEPGALNLLRAVAAAGHAAGGPSCFKDPGKARPGDLLGWYRGEGHGHVGIVELLDDDLVVGTLEGNVGRYPAKYRRLQRDVHRDPQFWGFARPPESL